MNRYTPTKKPAKTKALPPWEAWNREHPELVCADSACPHNRQTVERRQTKAWRYLHILSHGRAAFTALTLADLADTGLPEARAAIELALECDLLMPAGTSLRGPSYARHAKPEGKKAPSAKTKQARAFGQASTTLWGARV